MSNPPDDMPPTEERGPDAGAAPDGGWRRWMPRRRTGTTPVGTSAATDETTARAATDPSVDEVPAPDGADDAAGSAADPAGPTGDAPARRWMPRRRTATPPPGNSSEPATGSIPAVTDPETDDGEPADADAEPVTAATAADGLGRLRRKRKRLLSEREVTVYHLGGLAFELYRHDRLHPEVMQRRAGEIALIDETVHDIDLRLEQLAADRRDRRTREPDPRTPVGNCVACRAPFQVDARFCWQCGARLLPDLPDPPQGVDLDAQATQTIERPDTR